MEKIKLNCELVEAPTYLTSAEAAEELDVTRSRISALIKSGRLVANENGITKESVNDYKSNRKNGRPLNSFKK